MSTEVSTKDRKDKMITVQSKSFTPFGRQFLGVHPRGKVESLNVYIMLMFVETIDIISSLCVLVRITMGFEKTCQCSLNSKYSFICNVCRKPIFAHFVQF